MKNLSRKRLLSLAITATVALASTAAQATNGYFSIGYGPSSRALAGATTALPQDAMAAAVNPANMGLVGSRADLSVTLFSPIREATSNFGNPGAGTSFTANSDKNYFIFPNFGYTRKLNDQMTAGITVYANGGLNTEYAPGATSPSAGVNLFGSDGRLGVNLAQLIFAPTIAYSVNEHHTFGASLLIGYQTFKAYGLQNFCGLKGDGTCNPMTGAGIGSAAANDGLTNQGTDNAYGLGVRVGWTGKLSDTVTVGAAYSSKIYMKRFKKYDKLFAEQGDFDIPANASIGIAVKANPKWTITGDVQWIGYSDVKSINNPGPSLTNAANVFADGQGFLGTDNGLGFGWENVTVFKLGAVYEHDSVWAWRMGISYGQNPIRNDQLAFNILAPAVVETHATVGFRYRPTGNPNNEWNVAYMHAFTNSENGPFPAAFGGDGVSDQTRLNMYQHAFEIGYTWKF